MRDAAQMLMEVLSGLEAGPMLDAMAARRLAALGADEAALALSSLLGRASGEPHERKVLASLCRALQGHEPALRPEERRAIRAAALGLGLGAVMALVTEARPDRAQEVVAHGESRAPGVEPLGRRTQSARTVTHPDRIARLALDDDPSVIRNLLLNPRLTEPMVIRLAARRPIPAAVLVEIARSRRWSRQLGVRRAIAHNPYASPALVNPMLPQLDEVDLRAVAEDPVLHPAVRSAALSLLQDRGSTALRPPYDGAV